MERFIFMHQISSTYMHYIITSTIVSVIPSNHSHQPISAAICSLWDRSRSPNIVLVKFLMRAQRRPPCGGRACRGRGCAALLSCVLQNGIRSGGLGFCLPKVRSFFVCKESCVLVDEAVTSYRKSRGLANSRVN